MAVPTQRKDFEGDEAKLDMLVVCHTCSEQLHIDKIKVRLLEQAERFDTQEALRKVHPKAAWHEEGPVHRHGDKYYVQLYLGSHEWLAVNVDDIREVWSDPGYISAKTYGWAYVPECHIIDTVRYLAPLEEICPPEQPDST